jgi:hypothetical protein
MLKRLLNGGEETNCVVFCPQPGLSETQLLNFFLKDCQDVKVLTTDPLDGLKHTDLLDIFATLDFNDNRSLTELVPSSWNVNSTSRSSSIVVVKSLTGLLFHYSPTQVARFIKYLEGGFKKVFCVVHEECVEPTTYESLTKLCSTIIRIQASQKNSHKGKKVCSIIHRKQSGKIVQSKELFSVTGDDKLEVEPFVHNKTQQSAEDDTEEIASNLTTFKIGTKQSEVEVKNNLVLPFYTDQQKSNFQGEVKVQKESNKIYYEPDSADDWDDEDPDDDLDL